MFDGIWILDAEGCTLGQDEKYLSFGIRSILYLRFDGIWILDAEGCTLGKDEKYLSFGIRSNLYLRFDGIWILHAEGCTLGKDEKYLSFGIRSNLYLRFDGIWILHAEGCTLGKDEKYLSFGIRSNLYLRFDGIWILHAEGCTLGKDEKYLSFGIRSNLYLRFDGIWILHAEGCTLVYMHQWTGSSLVVQVVASNYYLNLCWLRKNRNRRKFCWIEVLQKISSYENVWKNPDSVHLREISQKTLKISILNMSLITIKSRIELHLPEDNHLKACIRVSVYHVPCRKILEKWEGLGKLHVSSPNLIYFGIV